MARADKQLFDIEEKACIIIQKPGLQLMDKVPEIDPLCIK
jgi:hypothetical protein